jgi:hypothetical protein
MRARVAESFEQGNSGRAGFGAADALGREGQELNNGLSGEKRPFQARYAIGFLRAADAIIVCFFAHLSSMLSAMAMGVSGGFLVGS